jgi:hypothetical protein
VSTGTHKFHFRFLAPAHISTIDVKIHKIFFPFLQFIFSYISVPFPLSAHFSPSSIPKFVNHSLSCSCTYCLWTWWIISCRPALRSFRSDYLGDYEAICETALSRESGPYRWSWLMTKNLGSKISCNCPFKTFRRDIKQIFRDERTVSGSFDFCVEKRWNIWYKNKMQLKLNLLRPFLSNEPGTGCSWMRGL